MSLNYFERVTPISGIRVIASGHSIRDLNRLLKTYGFSRWKKLKGIAVIRLLESGEIFKAELHWYEAHGIGKKEIKIKRILE